MGNKWLHYGSMGLQLPTRTKMSFEIRIPGQHIPSRHRNFTLPTPTFLGHVAEASDQELATLRLALHQLCQGIHSVCQQPRQICMYGFLALPTQISRKALFFYRLSAIFTIYYPFRPTTQQFSKIEESAPSTTQRLFFWSDSPANAVFRTCIAAPVPGPRWTCRLCKIKPTPTLTQRPRTAQPQTYLQFHPVACALCPSQATSNNQDWSGFDTPNSSKPASKWGRRTNFPRLNAVFSRSSWSWAPLGSSNISLHGWLWHHNQHRLAKSLLSPPSVST